MKCFIPVILTLSILCFSCKHKQTEEEAEKEHWDKTVEKTITYWQNRKMDFPTGLPVMQTDTSNFVNGKSTARQKIVAYVNGNCGICVDHLKHWKQFINDIRAKNGKCDFVFYITAENKDSFQLNIMKPLNLNVTWIYDKKDEFINKNDLTDERFQTVLLNAKDTVLMLGTMIFRPQLEELYKQIILEKSGS